MKINYAPTHELKTTCPYCGQSVRVQINLKSSTTDGGSSVYCFHYDSVSVSPSGKFVTFQDEDRNYPKQAAYIYQKAEVIKL